MTLNPNSLHNLKDEDLIRELHLRYPVFIFCGMDVKGRVISPFDGSMIECLGLTTHMSHDIRRFFEEKSRREAERSSGLIAH